MSMRQWFYIFWLLMVAKIEVTGSGSWIEIIMLLTFQILDQILELLSVFIEKA
jgi:hypothetical protein